MSHPPISSNIGPCRRNADDWCLSDMKRPLQCAEQQESHLQHHPILRLSRKWFRWLILVLHETSSTMRRASGVILPISPNIEPDRKKTLMIYARQTWNVHCTVRSNGSHTSNITQYCACHEKRRWWLMLVRHEASITMRWATGVTLQHHQTLRLPRNSEFEISPENPWIASTKNKGDSRIIRPWSDDKIVISHPRLSRAYLSHLGNKLCMEKFNISRSGYLPKKKRLPRNKNNPQHCACDEKKLMIDPRHIWNIHPVQGAKHQESSSSITKCACHSTVRSSTIPYSTLLNSTILYSTLLYCTLLYTRLFYTLLCSSLLYSTLLFSIPYSTLLCSALLCSTLVYYSILYSTLLYYSLLDSTIPYPRPYSSLLFSTLFYSSLHFSTLLYSALLYSTRLFYTLLYSSLLFSTRLYYSLLSTLLFSTLLYSSPHFSTILYSTLLFSSLDSTLLDSTILYCTILYFTLLYSTLLF